MMYPEVHTLADANLCLERCGGTMPLKKPVGLRNLLTPSHNARCHDSTKGPLRAVTEPIQMATLGGGHRTRTLWQPLGAVTGNRQIARRDLHNLIGDPDACAELYTTMIELRTPPTV